jgi:hypothetical protein
LTDADLIAGLQQIGLHYTPSVDVRAVRASQIDDEELITLILNDGMM